MFHKYIDQICDTQHFVFDLFTLQVSALTESHRKAVNKTDKYGAVTELVRLVAIYQYQRDASP